jgi:membrane-associated phospholipid phosphatase
MKRFSIWLVTAAVVLGAAGAALTAGSANARTAPAPGQVVIDWNRILVGIVNTPGAQPAAVQPTRDFAIVHAAIYDAVDSIDGTHQPYLVSVRAPRGASEVAAADAAAHAALDALYPSQQPAIDADYALELAQVRDGAAKVEGVRVGSAAAAALLAARADDGSNISPPPFVPGTAPGAYRSTPPNFPAAAFTTWGQVEPFVLGRADRFRPAAPPALTSHAYAAAIEEVQSLGSAASTTRTADQTQIAQFWSPPIQNVWNQIAESVAGDEHSDLVTTARLFASLNLSLADSAIALYDAKYTYQLWRPVSAIRLADTDGNPETAPDPNWLPLSGNTAADPSYPGAHSTISAAAADVLASFYGNAQHFSVTSTALAGVTRSFASFSGAAEEAGLSRIYAGQHTRIDHVAGVVLGNAVGRFVLANALASVGSRRGR